MKFTALFSGQGAQYPGMGKELWENFPQVREIYTCGGDVLGFDLKKLSFEGPEAEMNRTIHAQPLIFAHSLACFAAAKEMLPAPDAVAGHSLGEFAALCCGGAFSMEAGMRIIGARARAMEAAAGSNPGAMYAVIGGDVQEVAAACERAGGLALPVNFNLPTQTVISGEEEAVSRAAVTLQEQGKKVVRLQVASGFHTSLMQEAADRFREEVAGIAFGAPQVDFYSNLTGGKHVVTDYPAYFAAHMVSPVRFVEQCAAMDADGVDICVEFGPKKTVATLAKKNVRRFVVGNVEDLGSLKKTEALFQQ